MKNHIARAVLSFSLSLIFTVLNPLFSQVSDSLKNSLVASQLRAELAQIQASAVSIKAKADSLEVALKAKRESQEYWSAMLQPEKNCCGEKSAELRADLVQDKLVKKESALRSYHLDLEIFRVNGKEQSPELTKKYQDKYLTRKPNGNRTTSMTYSGRGSFGIKR